jgi:hypothetical protein
MAFWHKWFRAPPQQDDPPPSAERQVESVTPREFFARQCEAHLRRKPWVWNVQRLEDEYGLLVTTVGGTSSTFFLNNAFAEARDLAPEARAPVIDAYVRALQHVESDAPTWNDVRDRLLTVVRATTLGITSPKGLVSRPSPMPFLSAYVVVDYEERAQFVTLDDAREWGQSVDELLDLGEERVVSRAPIAVLPFDDQPGLLTLTGNEFYQTSTLLRPQWLEQLKARLDGAPVVCAPRQDFLLVTGDEDKRAMARMVQLAASEYAAGPRPLAPIMYRFAETGALEPCVLGGASEEAASSRRSLHGFMMDAFNTEAERIRDALERRAEDLFVANVMHIEEQETYKATTLCTWAEGVESILASAGHVMLCGERSGKTWFISAPLSVVLEHAGQHLEPYPDSVLPRLRTRGFPDEDTLAKIKAAGADWVSERKPS